MDIVVGGVCFLRRSPAYISERKNERKIRILFVERNRPREFNLRNSHPSALFDPHLITLLISVVAGAYNGPKREDCSENGTSRAHFFDRKFSALKLKCEAFYLTV